MFLSILKSADIIGPSPVLLINNSTRFKSHIGGMLSILIAIFSIVCFILFGIDIIKREKPDAILSKEFIKSPILNRNETFFMFSVMLEGEDVKDPEKKYFMYFQYTNTVGKNKTTTKIPVVPCVETNAYKTNPYNASSSLISKDENYYCLPDSFNNSILGSFGDSLSSIYEFRVEICNNSTMNGQCADLELIQTELCHVYMHFIYLDYFVDINDYLYPIKPILRGDLLAGAAAAMRTDEYNFKMINLNTDSGWILDSMDEVNVYQLDVKNNFFHPLNPMYMFSVQISLSSLKDVYHRKYIKIQAVAANTGGVVKLIIVFFTLINNFFAKNLLMDELLFNYNKKNEDLNKRFKGKNSISCSFSNDRINLIQINNIPFTSKLNSNNINNNNEECQLKSAMRVPNNTIKIPSLKPDKHNNVNRSKRSCLSIVLRCCNQKMNKFNKLSKFYEKKLDVKNIIKYSEKAKYTDYLIFGEKGKDIKNILFHNNFINNLIKEKKEINENIFSLYLDEVKAGGGDQTSICSGLYKEVINNFNMGIEYK